MPDGFQVGRGPKGETVLSWRSENGEDWLPTSRRHVGAANGGADASGGEALRGLDAYIGFDPDWLASPKALGAITEVQLAYGIMSLWRSAFPR